MFELILKFELIYDSIVDFVLAAEKEDYFVAGGKNLYCTFIMLKNNE